MLCDLHLHTTKSDGVWTPERMFEEIRARDLQFFSITDHDCIDAYPVPEDLRDRCIPGLEVDSEHEGHTVHILAYGIDDPNSPLLEALRQQRHGRLNRMAQMVARLNALNVAIALDDVLTEARGGNLGRPHLARALVARGYVSSVQEAFNQFLADGGDGYVALKRLTSAQIIDLIHESEGVAVVAHPMRLHSASHLEQLCDLGTDGIEVIHPSADDDNRRQLQALATARGLLRTGGSDFHTPEASETIGVKLEYDVSGLTERHSTRSGSSRRA